jgi:NAD-dependent SIR2 family protein deacetylase
MKSELIKTQIIDFRRSPRESKLNSKYLNNGYFYLTCNCCEKLIPIKEMTEDQYNFNLGYCETCYKEMF